MIAKQLFECIAATAKAGPISISGFGDLAVGVVPHGNPTRAEDWAAKVFLEAREAVDPDATAVPRAGTSLTHWLVKNGVAHGEAERQVRDFALSLREAMLAGEIVDLAPVGVLAVLTSAETLVRHPSTHKWTRVPPTKRPVLELSDALKAALAG